MRWRLFNVEIDAMAREDVPRRIIETMDFPRSSRPMRVGYANPHAAVLAETDESFRRNLTSQDIVILDGVGLAFAARALGVRDVLERATPPGWFHDIVEEANRRGWSIGLLGDEPDVVEAMANRVELEFPNQIGVRYRDGFGVDAEAMLAFLGPAPPDVLVIAMGMPLQEHWSAWVANNAPQVRLIIVVGALFKYATGAEWRGPAWIEDSGFEWVVRLLRHPIRYFERYVIEGFRFLRVVAKWRLHGRTATRVDS